MKQVTLLSMLESVLKSSCIPPVTLVQHGGQIQSLWQGRWGQSSAQNSLQFYRLCSILIYMPSLLLYLCMYYQCVSLGSNWHFVVDLTKTVFLRGIYQSYWMWSKGYEKNNFFGHLNNCGWYCASRDIVMNFILKRFEAWLQSFELSDLFCL